MEKDFAKLVYESKTTDYNGTSLKTTDVEMVLSLST